MYVARMVNAKHERIEAAKQDRHRTLGKVAYEAYCTGYENQEPSWESLSEEDQTRWRRVAKVLRFTVEDEVRGS